ncbi:unnamed protein product, partial [Cuscuta europaea]
MAFGCPSYEDSVNRDMDAITSQPMRVADLSEEQDEVLGMKHTCLGLALFSACGAYYPVSMKEKSKVNKKIKSKKLNNNNEIKKRHRKNLGVNLGANSNGSPRLPSSFKLAANLNYSLLAESTTRLREWGTRDGVTGLAQSLIGPGPKLGPASPGLVTQSSSRPNRSGPSKSGSPRRPTFQPDQQPASSPSRSLPCSPASNLTTAQQRACLAARPATCLQPSREPAVQPSGEPAFQPCQEPVLQPSGEPAFQLSGELAYRPNRKPAFQPSGEPAYRPNRNPAFRPNEEPFLQPVGSLSSSPAGSLPSNPAEACRPRSSSVLPASQPGRVTTNNQCAINYV